MITRIALAVLLLVLGISAPSAQLSMMNVGPGSNGPPLAACGTGVIDLSAGCSLPIALGLVP